MSLQANGEGEVVQLDGMLLRRAVARIEHVANGLDALREDMRGLRATLGRSSSHNLDAQALQQQIEGLATEMRGNSVGAAAVVARLEKAIGAAPDKAMDVAGSGILGALDRLNNLRTVAIVAIGAAITGGGAVATVLHFLGGH